MNKQKSYKAVMIESLILSATIMLMTTASAQGKTVIYKFTAELGASDITDKKVNSSDFGLSAGDTLSVRVHIDSEQNDLDSHTDKARFENGTIDLSFTITSASGAVIYTSTTSTNQHSVLKLEDNHNSDHDKLELTDESDRSSLSDGAGDHLFFEKFKLKLQDDNMSALESTTPIADPTMVIGDWSKKNEYEIKWKDGGDYIKLKGDFDSLKVVPIPAAAWLFGSALLAFFSIARRRPA